MTPSIRISQKLVDRIASISSKTEPILGKLYGILAKNSLTILDVVLEIDLEDDDIDLSYSFPAEIDICGVFHISDEIPDFNIIKESLYAIDVTDTPVLLCHNLSSGQSLAYLYKNDKFETTNLVTISQQELYEQFLYIQVIGQFPITFELSSNGVSETFDHLRRTVASGVIAFNNRKENSIYLLGSCNAHSLIGCTSETVVDDLLKNEEKVTKKRQQIKAGLDVIPMQMLQKMTNDSNESISIFKKHAPLCIFQKKHCITVKIVVNVDALALLHRQTLVANLYEILVESAIKYLRLCEKCLLEYINDEHISAPASFHFFPEALGHFITLIYLEECSDQLLRNKRSLIHKKLMLPMNRPQFRKANKYVFEPSPQSNESRLVNPHLAIKTNNSSQSNNNNHADSRISLVIGKYLYYHYGQDGLNDNGWGCAYRSLQTIASWFQLQGYINRPVPNFTEIQRCLVDIGDKSHSFLDSKQWIGSTEVGFVLDSLLGITSRIKHVNNGDEMSNAGPELVRHFEWHGCPVMIGGGVLAHTILGVDYNQQTGVIKFLILDPHYNGGEDLKTVINKGWCGWKGVDFWKKSTYYNMCLPQVPTML